MDYGIIGHGQEFPKGFPKGFERAGQGLNGTHLRSYLTLTLTLLACGTGVTNVTLFVELRHRKFLVGNYDEKNWWVIITRVYRGHFCSAISLEHLVRITDLHKPSYTKIDD